MEYSDVWAVKCFSMYDYSGRKHENMRELPGLVRTSDGYKTAGKLKVLQVLFYWTIFMFFFCNVDCGQIGLGQTKKELCFWSLD